MIYTERSVPSTSVNFNQSSIDYSRKHKRNQSRLKLTEIGEIVEHSIFFNKFGSKGYRVNRKLIGRVKKSINDQRNINEIR